jgi:hypothetical protein
MQDTGMFLVMEPHSVEWDLGFALASHRYATMRHKTNQCCLSLSFTFLWRLRYEGAEGSKSRFLVFYCLFVIFFFLFIYFHFLYFIAFFPFLFGFLSSFLSSLLFHT